MASEPVLIFGPTGHVGSSTARAAHEHGANIIFAMRDTNKAVPGFSADQERGIERVYADLTKPDTIQEAVTKTGAKRAFMYLVFTASDHMRSSITALKSAGIEFIVFLSSYTVPDDLNSLSKDTNFIALAHGKVETVLKEVYGPAGYVAVRPGGFATNSLRWKDMIKSGGDIKTPYPEALFDWISNDDIGRVAGSVLARGPEVIQENGGRNWMLLFGPHPISQADAIETICKVTGRDAKIMPLDEEGSVEFYTTTSHLPEPLSRQMVGMLKKRAELGKSDGLEGPKYEQAVANIQKFGGKAPTGFKQWVEENKDEFEA
ncbi:hypothetical protein LTS07_008928 [Exophiala sideris]|uniref:NmrA-like domain-containing protein n=1 Tax=Exophiala sideris TaxID=1016849 RepID=A0ABR0J0Y2_9EURO|nr:hypothetical protein LTS07_008928 [Exophiala sideris]KAK5030178.1 hypothetical protein LTR13_008491 [Exophiala sideris]KAK5053673.1 hypothetical protein LTR69_009318 [Exophiala sideris]KAK5179284.1 hypothetical protein LTR44_008122 [Eurotiomycetes sp. CCFEE 6388]